MSDNICHMIVKLLLNCVSGVKTLGFCHIYATFLWPSLHNVTKIGMPQVVYRF